VDGFEIANGVGMDKEMSRGESDQQGYTEQNLVKLHGVCRGRAAVSLGNKNEKEKEEEEEEEEEEE
jgi:hypothetical protein